VRYLLILLFLATCGLLSAGSVEFRVENDAADLKISYQDGYALPSLPGCEPGWEPGEPLLPVAVCRVLIPAGARATGIQVLSLSQQDVPGEYLVYPAQMPRPISEERVQGNQGTGDQANLDSRTPEPRNPRTPGPFVRGDPQVYESDQPWPAVVARLGGTGEKAGFRIAEVFVYPLRWTPLTRRLELCDEILVRVDYADETPGASPRTTRQLSSAITGLRELVTNPQDIARFAPMRRIADPPDLDYVVITNAQLAAQFEPLLDWYGQTGLAAEVKTREWIVANYPGIDVPEKIRNFIIDFYANHGLTYVLLAGDTQIVPCRKGRASVPGYLDDLPTDLYYADLQWSWDGDHDGIWGEYGDDTVDFYADVSVGRAPVDDSAQAANFVNKVLGYELQPAPGYLARMLLPYTALYSTPYYSGRNAQDSVAAFLPEDWQSAPFTGMTTVGPIHDSIESGFGLCHAVAHGNSTGFYTMGGNPIYTVAAAGSQTNGRKLPVLTSIACYSGNFEYDDCLAEALMNNPNGGCVAAIMNSRYGIAQPPGCGPAEKLDIRFFDCLFQGQESGNPGIKESRVFPRILESSNPGVLFPEPPNPWTPAPLNSPFELGRAHSAARDFYAANGRAGGIWQWSLYELNLFGDPRMPVWTGEPQLLLAEFPSILNFGTQQVMIRVTQNSRPRAGARVRLFKAGEFDATGFTGSDGRVALSINPLTQGVFQVVTTAQDGIPVRDSGLVRQNGACVQVLSFAIVDSAPGGNSDGILNPGETVSLPTWFRNSGNQPANGVSVVLRSADSGITVLDSVAGLGTLNPGDSALATGFRFRAAESCTNGHLAVLGVLARDENDSVWHSRIPVIAGTSVLSLTSFRLNDSLPGGNRNSRLDPGETAELVVRLGNRGFGNGYTVSGILRSSDARLAVPDSLGEFGTIAQDSFGSNETDRFLVSADSLIPLETVVACSLLVQAAGEPVRRLSLLLPIGQIRACDPVPDTGGATHRYYAYDDGDTGYAQSPVFDWVELRGLGTDIGLDSNDKTVRVSLPFPLRYFGTRFLTISVCSNGWLAAGSTVARNWVNHQMPTGGAPGNMIAANWDNLDPGVAGTVWYRFDTAGRRVIIEWDSVAYHDTTGLREAFEVIIYDTTRVTPTGDNEIVFQYRTANFYGSSSIGIQNGNSMIGVNYLFDSAYHRAAATILAGRAIKFTTFAPSGIAAPSPDPLPLTPVFLTVLPSIARDQVEFRYALAEPGRLSVFDRAGREVVGMQIAESGMRIAVRGLRVSGFPSGIYFCRLKSPSRTAICRFVLVR
jgi:hypothetical protein